MIRSVRSRLCASVAVLALAVFGFIAGSGPATGAGATYRNPVTAGVTDTFADPTIIKAKDGYWYAYGTTDSILQFKGDENLHYLPILRSADMVHWKYLGDVWTPQNRPSWHPADAFLWAPDINYLHGKYYLYYSVAKPGGLFTVGVATAPTPTGPWTDSGGPVVPQGQCDVVTNIDPMQFTASNGKSYLYWGSFRSVCVAELDATDTRIQGAVHTVYTGPGEGSYVTQHGGYYYLFISEASCCNGAFSGYEVKVGRARSPLGPFVDAEGVRLTDSVTSGTFVVAANGNKWIGPGHNTLATDLSGQNYFVYHALDKDNPTLAPPLGAPRRPMLIDRLDWIDGWPVVNAGAFASAAPRPAPVTTWAAGSYFNGSHPLAGWRRAGGWSIAHEQDAHGYVRRQAPSRRPSFLVTDATGPADFYAQADLRLSGDAGRTGLVAAYRDEDNYVVAWLDAGRHALITDAILGGRSAGTEATALPADLDLGNWHHVAMTVRGNRMNVVLSGAATGDWEAAQDRTLPRGANRAGSVGIASSKARSAADNVGVAALFTPVQKRVPDPRVGRLDPGYSDEFGDGVAPGSAADAHRWQWVRDPEGTEANGAFVWPTDGKELYRDTNTASVLTETAPAGAYTVDTRLTFTDSATPAQQAGLVLYDGDDEYLKLVHSYADSADHHQTEFAKEGPTGYGNNFVGPTAQTTWLRLSHRIDPANGEHEVRAATSTDGRHWVWGAVWTMPAQDTLRIGLISLNSTGATASFDYVRVYRP